MAWIVGLFIEGLVLVIAISFNYVSAQIQQVFGAANGSFIAAVLYMSVVPVLVGALFMFLRGRS